MTWPITAARYAAGAPVDTSLFSDIITQLTGVSSLSASNVDPSGAPMVVNGSFEADANGTDGSTMTSWVWVAGTGGTGTVVNTSQNHGAKSFKITRDTTGGHSGGVVTSAAMNCSPGIPLELIFMLLCSENDVNNQVGIQWFAADGSSISTTTVYNPGSPYNQAPTSWQVFNFSVTPPASAATCKIVLTGGDSSNAPAGTTSIYFDGVMFSKRTEWVTAVTQTSGNFTVPAGVFKVKVEIDAMASLNSGSVKVGGYSMRVFSVKPGQVLTCTSSLLNAGTNTISDGTNSCSAQNGLNGGLTGTASSGMVNINGGSRTCYNGTTTPLFTYTY